MISKYFLPFSGLPFHFVGGFLCCVEAFRVSVVDVLCVLLICFWHQIKYMIAQIYVKELAAWFLSFLFFFFFFKLLILYWGIADEQCCDSFRWTGKGLDYMCTGIRSPPNSPAMRSVT